MSRAIHVAVMLVLVLGGVGTLVARSWRVSHMLTPEEIEGIPARLARIPLAFEDAGFRGTRETLADDVVEMSGADHYATVVYRDGAGGAVRLHVGAAARTDAWFHEPTVCMPMHGWTTTRKVLAPIWTGLEGVAPDTQVWRMTLHKTGEEMLVYYWLQYGKHIVTTRFERAWRRFQGLLGGEKDQPVQIVILYAAVERGEDETEERVSSLIRALWPHLSTVLSPGEQDHAPSPQ